MSTFSEMDPPGCPVASAAKSVHYRHRHTMSHEQHAQKQTERPRWIQSITVRSDHLCNHVESHWTSWPPVPAQWTLIFQKALYTRTKTPGNVMPNNEVRQIHIGRLRRLMYSFINKAPTLWLCNYQSQTIEKVDGKNTHNFSRPIKRDTHRNTHTHTKHPCQERKQLDVYSTMSTFSEMDPQTDRQTHTHAHKYCDAESSSIFGIT